MSSATRGRAAFNQAQGRFTLPHAALAADEDAHSAHVHHAAVQGDAFREFVFQNDGGGVDEFHGHQARAEDADAGFIRQLHDFPGWILVTGEDDARHLAPEHALNARFAHAFRQFLKIGQLRGAENLDTFVGKVGVEAGDRQPGAVEGGFADVAAEAGGAVDKFQLKGFLVLAVKFGQSDEIHFLHFGFAEHNPI